MNSKLMIFFACMILLSFSIAAALPAAIDQYNDIPPPPPQQDQYLDRYHGIRGAIDIKTVSEETDLRDEFTSWDGKLALKTTILVTKIGKENGRGYLEFETGDQGVEPGTGTDQDSPRRIYEGESITGLTGRNNWEYRKLSVKLDYVMEIQGSGNLPPMYLARTRLVYGEQIAKYRVGPDLTVSGISINNINPKEGEAIRGNITFKNIGNETSEAASMKYFFDTEREPYVLYINLPSMQPGQSISWMFYGGPFEEGQHTFTAIADVGKNIEELDETNNELSMEFHVYGDVLPADLEVTSVEFEETNEHTANKIKVIANVKNLGDEFNEETVISLYDNGELVETQDFAPIRGNDTQIIEFLWTIKGGTHNLSVVVAENTLSREMSTANNANDRTYVKEHTDCKKLYIRGAGINAGPYTIYLDKITDNPTETNKTPTQKKPLISGTATLKLKIGESEQTLDLLQGTETEFGNTVNLFSCSGHQGITDPPYWVELDADPLSGTGTPPDLTVTNIEFSNNQPRTEEEVAVTVTVENIGDEESNYCLMDFLVDGIPQKPFDVMRIPAQGKMYYSTQWTATEKGLHQMEFYVDSANAVEESNELNNVLKKTIQVKEKEPANITTGTTPPTTATPPADTTPNTTTGGFDPLKAVWEFFFGPAK
ncbi:MAG: CARDB domain-containing protein [Candidatus Diapherotrites archaeon]